MPGTVSHNLLDNLYESKVRWYWSLKPGTFVDKLSGKNPYPDLVTGQWTGTIPEWNKSLMETVRSMALNTFEELNEEDKLFVPNTIYSKFTPEMLGLWHGKVVIKDVLPFDVILIKSKDGTCGNVKVLNISEKGNLI